MRAAAKQNSTGTGASKHTGPQVSGRILKQRTQRQVFSKLLPGLSPYLGSNFLSVIYSSVLLPAILLSRQGRAAFSVRGRVVVLSLKDIFRDSGVGCVLVGHS